LASSRNPFTSCDNLGAFAIQVGPGCLAEDNLKGGGPASALHNRVHLGSTGTKSSVRRCPSAFFCENCRWAVLRSGLRQRPSAFMIMFRKATNLCKALGGRGL